MARPTLHSEPVAPATFRALSADWKDMEAIYGGKRAEIVRQLIAAHLGRPGAELPPPPSQAALRRARQARKAAAS